MYTCRLTELSKTRKGNPPGRCTAYVRYLGGSGGSTVDMIGRGIAVNNAFKSIAVFGDPETERKERFKTVVRWLPLQG